MKHLSRHDLPKANKDKVYETYDKIYKWMDENRTKDLSLEKSYVDMIEKHVSSGSHVLDVGCGTGEPWGKYFINAGYDYIGVDASQKSIDLCKQRFPDETWLLCDMRRLRFEQKFNVVMAWHSLFHLPKACQRKTLQLLSSFVEQDGLLLFTSGPDEGEIWSDNGGYLLYHASLAARDYQTLLENNGFKIIAHHVEDPECGGATVWVAQKST